MPATNLKELKAKINNIIRNAPSGDCPEGYEQKADALCTFADALGNLNNLLALKSLMICILNNFAFDPAVSVEQFEQSLASGKDSAVNVLYNLATAEEAETAD